MTDSAPDFHLPADMPLAIDVDGTLLRSDITQEMFWLGLLKFPWLAPKILALIAKDRPALKALLMPRLINVWAPEHLPYNPRVLKIARGHKAAGGKVILCSGSEGALIDRIADHFDFLDAGFGTSATLNLVQGNKATFLKDRYPDGFCYIGNSTQDFTVWPSAKLALAIAPPKGVEDIRDIKGNPVIVLEPREPELSAVFEATRPAAWPYILMSVLVTRFFWPPIGMSGDKTGFFGASAFAVMALFLFISGGFLISDLRRAASHRAHKEKRFRPLPDGRLGASTSMIAGLAFMIAGLGIAACLPTTMKAVTAVSLGLYIIGYGLISLKNSVFQ